MIIVISFRWEWPIYK